MNSIHERWEKAYHSDLQFSTTEDLVGVLKALQYMVQTNSALVKNGFSYFLTNQGILTKFKSRGREIYSAAGVVMTLSQFFKEVPSLFHRPCVFVKSPSLLSEIDQSFLRPMFQALIDSVEKGKVIKIASEKLYALCPDTGFLGLYSDIYGGVMFDAEIYPEQLYQAIINSEKGFDLVTPETEKSVALEHVFINWRRGNVDQETADSIGCLESQIRYMRKKKRCHLRGTRRVKI